MLNDTNIEETMDLIGKKLDPMVIQGFYAYQSISVNKTDALYGTLVALAYSLAKEVEKLEDLKRSYLITLGGEDDHK